MRVCSALIYFFHSLLEATHSISVVPKSCVHSHNALPYTEVWRQVDAGGQSGVPRSVLRLAPGMPDVGVNGHGLQQS